MPPGPEADETARQWTIGFVRQVKFSYPDANFGCKKADDSRPISKDSIAQIHFGGIISGWDLLSGAGTGKPTLALDPDSQDITGQVFVPVTPLDTIGGGNEEPSPKPDAERQYPGDQFGTIIGDVLFLDYFTAGQPPNPSMGVWFLRVVYDYLADMPLTESIDKHRKEWRQILGLHD